MATTNISIVNKALTRIGAPTITSFDDGSREAEVMDELYEYTYQTLLGEAQWNFATKDIELAQSVASPVDCRYTYEYLLPSDYIHLVEYFTSGGSRITDYTKQGDYVLTNHSTLFVKYVYQPSESELPVWFVNVLVLKLAHDSTENLVGIGSNQDRLAQEWNLFRGIAYKMDSKQGAERDVLAPSRYITARY